MRTARQGAVHAFLQRAQIGGQLLPAASARRGRGNRPSCRACRLRGPAPSPASRNARHRRWRRCTMWPPVIGGIVIGSGPHRVVVIARIFRIDGDERNGAQIGAACADRPAWRASASSIDFLRKLRRNAVRVNGDQADRSWACSCCRGARPRARAGSRRRGRRAARPAPVRCARRRRGRACRR